MRQQSLAEKVVAEREARERNAELRLELKARVNWPYRKALKAEVEALGGALEEADAAFRARTNGPIPRTGDAAKHRRRPLVAPDATAATIESAAWRQRPDVW